MESVQSKSKTFSTVRQIVTVATVVFYIVFSGIKRLGDNPELFWIPIILVGANILLLAELTRNMYMDKMLRTTSNKTWLVVQVLINIGLAALIYSYI